MDAEYDVQLMKDYAKSRKPNKVPPMEAIFKMPKGSKKTKRSRTKKK